MRILLLISLTFMYHGFALSSLTSRDDAPMSASDFNETLAQQIAKYSVNHDEKLWGEIFEKINDPEFSPNDTINGKLLAQLIFSIRDETFTEVVVSNPRLDLAVKDSDGNSLLHTMFDRLRYLPDFLKENAYENWFKRDQNNIIDILQDNRSSNACKQHGYLLWLKQNENNIEQLLKMMIEHKDSGDSIRWGLERLDLARIDAIVDFAVQHGNGQIIQAIHDSKICPVMINMKYRDSNGNSLAHIATIAGNTEALDMLHTIDESIILSQDVFGRTPIHYAITHGDFKMLKMLHQWGINMDTQDNQKQAPVHFAMQHQDMDMLKTLYQMNANMNATNNLNQTLAHIAAWQGNIEALKLLYQWGVDMDTKDSRGRTPALLAMEKHSDMGILEALYQMNVNMNATNNLNQTLAHIAAQYKRIEAFKLLHQWGVDMNTPDDNGKTPAHHATWRPCMDVLKALHQEGANMNIKDNRGLTPALLAKEHGHIKQYEELLQMESNNPQS